MASDKVSYELKSGDNRFEIAYDDKPVIITDSGFSTSDVRLIAVLDASPGVKRVSDSGSSTSDAKDKS